MQDANAGGCNNILKSTRIPSRETKRAIIQQKRENQFEMVDISEYKVGVVLDLEEQSSKGGKDLKICRVNVGDPDAPLSIVTSAPNVRQGSR